MEKDPQLNEPHKKVTLAQERMKATPGDADSWFESSDSSLSGMDSEPQNDQESNLDNLTEETNNLEIEKKEVQKETENTSAKVQKQSTEKPRLNDPEKIKQLDKHYLSFSHSVDSKFLILLKIMAKSRRIDLLQVADMKIGEGFIDFHSQGSKIIIRTTSKERANESINKISDYIDDLNIIKLQVRPQLAYKIQSFYSIRKQLKKRNIFIIGVQNHKKSRQLYIGGHIKIPQLRKIHQELKNYRIYYFGLRLFRNKRSYKHILNLIFQTETLQQELLKFNRVNMIEVDRKGNDNCIKCYLNTNSKVDISPVEYEEFIYKIVKKFFVLTFVLKKEKFYPKIMVPEHPEIIFRFFKDHNAGVDYMFVICGNKVFFKQAALIAKQLEQIGQSIIGIRFFNYIEPNFKYFYFDSAGYIVRKFPVNNTYSMFVSAKTREGKKFYWRQVFNLVMQLKDRYTQVQESMILD